MYDENHEAWKADMEQRHAEAGAPDALEMWAALWFAGTPDTTPLTVAQAAKRLGVSEKWVRRRLSALAAMNPPGAHRTSDSPRAPWRIIPAALERLCDAGTVEPEPAKPPRGRRSTAGAKKRSATRWEV